MRVSLFILGLIVAIVCVEKPAEAQNGAWCLYQDGDGDGSPKCRYATLQQAWPTGSGVAPVRPVHTHRRNHLRQQGSEGTKRLRLSIPAQEEPTAHGPR